MYTWIQKFIASDIIEDLERNQKNLSKCIGTKAEVLTEFTDFKKECYEEKARLHAQLAESYTSIAKEQKNAAYWMSQVRGLEIALNDAITIPDLDLEEGDLTIVKPASESVFIAYDDFVIADSEYYLLPHPEWLRILGIVHGELEEWVGSVSTLSWIKYVWDCDNWSYAMNNLVAMAMLKAGFKRQLAFMITWQKGRHAYNAFMDGEKEIWIYEPQSNAVIGRLGETLDPYDTNMIWFPGGRV